MNPDQPSREQIEARITALLLGELPADEAALLRYTMTQDPALKKLHDELQSTLALVREAAKHPADAPMEKAAALKLSAERRQKLLEHFKTPRAKPEPLFWLKPIRQHTLIELLVVVAIVAILAAMMLPALSRAKMKSRGVAAMAAARREEMEANTVNPAHGTYEPPSGSVAPTVPAAVAVSPEPQLAPAPAALPTQIVLPSVQPEGDQLTDNHGTHVAGVITSGSQATGSLMSPNEIGSQITSPTSSHVYSQQVVGFAQVPTPSDGTFLATVPFTSTPNSAGEPVLNNRGEIQLPRGGRPVGGGGAGGFGVYGIATAGGGIAPTVQYDLNGDIGARFEMQKKLDESATSFALSEPAASGGAPSRGTSGFGPAEKPKAEVRGFYNDVDGKKVPQVGDIPAGSAGNLSLVQNTPAIAFDDNGVSPPSQGLTTEAQRHRELALDDGGGNRSGAQNEPTAGGHGFGPGFSRMGPKAPAQEPAAPSAVPEGAAPNTFSGEVQSINVVTDNKNPAPQRGTTFSRLVEAPAASGTVRIPTPPPVAATPPTVAAGSSESTFAFNSSDGTAKYSESLQPADKSRSTAVKQSEGNQPGYNWYLGQQVNGTGGTSPSLAPGKPIELGVNPAHSLDAGDLTLGAATGSFQTGLARDDVSGLRYVTNGLPAPGAASENQNFFAGRYAYVVTNAIVMNDGKESISDLDSLAQKTPLYPSQVTVLAGKRSPNSTVDAEPLQNQQYDEAKRELEQQLDMHKLLYAKLEAEKLDLSLPKGSMVQITDPAEPPKSQSTWQRLTGQYAATARMKVGNDVADIQGMSSGPGANGYDPYFIQTTFEVMQSELVLGKVVDALKLDTAWARSGQKLAKTQAVEMLKRRLDLQPVQNTKLIAITAKSSDPQEAADIANAVAKAYTNYRIEARREMTTNGVAVLEQQFQEQQSDIKTNQAFIEQLRKELHIVDEDTNAAAATPVVAPQVDVPIRRPSTNAPVPQPEILTSSNAFSTFSLNVSDVSFKFAEASLQNGKLPDTASIRSEEFINAFDYRDPEAAAGQPMAFTSERARYPFAQNRELLRFSIKTAAAGRQAGRALNLVLLLDNSGSMERADRVEIIRESLRVLATQLQPQDTVSVVTFARTPRLWADGISGDKAGEALSQVGGITPEGGTNLEEAMRLAYETARRHYLAGGMNRVVLLTDGAANLGNVEPSALKEKVEAQRKQGIALDCFGIGWEDFNDDLLEQLSSNGDGRYAFLNSPEDASKEFAAKLAGALQVAAADVKVQVEFNPRRVISYRQIGYAKHQLTKEQFRDNTVDAAEIAAQEAGNALYTIETNPNGDGPVATVHVRYKVPGTQIYNERSWDVAYTGSAPAMEQASPAMRLASTASAFSEWLAASPYAQEVTLDELVKGFSGVPEVYGVDDRPQRLATMIREAKSLEGK